MWFACIMGTRERRFRLFVLPTLILTLLTIEEI